MLEHSRAVQPSTILSVYLLISLLCDITIVRTLYLRDETQAILGLSTASIALKPILLLLETQDKRKYLKKPYNEWSREATSGVINRSFFWWLNPLFILGFRRILVSTNLSPLDPDLLSKPLEESMTEAWARCRQ
jgi:ATP-binding cassette subfamily C (CFTR/MRP) protein 1